MNESRTGKDNAIAHAKCDVGNGWQQEVEFTPDHKLPSRIVPLSDFKNAISARFSVSVNCSW